MADIPPSAAATATHPYFPPGAVIPGYVANDKDVTELMVKFGAVAGAVVGSALWLTARSRQSPRGIDRFAAAWFALCGFLHVAFEGYYLVYRHQLPGMSTLFAQLWKEYALSDSRYLTHDVFTISVETITALAWGPLCLFTVVCIVRGSRARHVAQVIACTAHAYGVALYYLTNLNEHRMHGVAYSRPEALYFWIYYVGFNLPWAVVPVVLLWDSWRQIGSAFAALEEKKKQTKQE